MAPKELTDYINTQKQAGFQDDVIKKALIDAGWQDSQVTGAFSGLTAPVAPAIQASEVSPQGDNINIQTDIKSTEASKTDTNKTNTSTVSKEIYSDVDKLRSGKKWKKYFIILIIFLVVIVIGVAIYISRNYFAFENLFQF